MISEEEGINNPGTIGYESNFFKVGEEKLFQELNFEIKKKINRKLKLSSTYINLFNNDKILKAQQILENGEHEKIYANILEFHLFGTHLDVWDNTEISRINQLNLIINEINKIQNPNIILLGDLNLLYKNQINNSDWNYILEHDKLRNVETLSIAINKIIDNNFIDSFDLIGKNPPKLSCCFDRRIDYIFLKKNIKFMVKNTFTVYSNCSDHLPIIIDLEYIFNSM